MYVLEQQRRQEKEIFEAYKYLPFFNDNRIANVFPREPTKLNLKKLYQQYSEITYKRVCEETFYNNDKLFIR